MLIKKPEKSFPRVPQGATDIFANGSSLLGAFLRSIIADKPQNGRNDAWRTINIIAAQICVFFGNSLSSFLPRPHQRSPRLLNRAQSPHVCFPYAHIYLLIFRGNFPLRAVNSLHLQLI